MRTSNPAVWTPPRPEIDDGPRSLTVNPTVAEVRGAWPDLAPKGGGWAGPCPVCGGDDRFHVKARADGTALIGCRGCIDNEPPDVRRTAFGEVMRALFPDRPMPAAGAGGNGAARPALAVDTAQPKTRAGLAAVLGTLGFAWRYNVRRMRDELRRLPAGEWLEANDRLIRDIRSQIPERFTDAGKKDGAPLVFGREAFADCFGALLNRAEMDPFREWLEGLDPWHREPRLSKWLSHIFTVDVEEAALAAWASRFLLLGAVWRTYRPGTKLDEMPVLIGGQGIGKSTALRELLPPEHPEWFSDGLRLAADDKVRAEALQGRVIVEAAEMAGSTRAERESLKSFLSRTDDGSVRLAYRQNPETALRRCVMAGTSNDPHCLPPDPSGNRRFVVLNVRAGADGAAGVRLYLKNFREQLWAEALHRYREDEAAYLPADLVDAQSEANAGAVQVDEGLEDVLLTFLDAWPATKHFRIADARRYSRPPITAERATDVRISCELQRLGCEACGRVRIEGVRGRYWLPPVPF